MPSKSDFTTEEWLALQQAPMSAGMLITMADPSVTDSIKESMAVASEIAKAVKSSSFTGLLGELLDEFSDLSAVRKAQPKFESRKPDELRSEILAGLRSAALLVDGKADAGDAATYKQFVYDIAVAAAEAAKEGDFLGFGGVRVSDEEKAALAQLAGILGIDS